jgi:hypothetical protein
MGYHADKSDDKFKNSFGSYYVNTTFDVPFCRDIHAHKIKDVINYKNKLSELILRVYPRKGMEKKMFAI